MQDYAASAELSELGLCLAKLFVTHINLLKGANDVLLLGEAFGVPKEVGAQFFFGLQLFQVNARLVGQRVLHTWCKDLDDRLKLVLQG